MAIPSWLITTTPWAISLLTVGTSIFSAKKSAAVTQEIAQANRKFNEELANINTTLMQGLKGYEFRLSYFKEILTKRLRAYEEAIDMAADLLSGDSQAKAGELPDFALRDAGTLARYTLRVMRFERHEFLLSPAARLCYQDFLKKVEVLKDPNPEEGFSLLVRLEGTQPLNEAEKSAEAFHKQLMTDLYSLGDIDTMLQEAGLPTLRETLPTKIPPQPSP